MTEKDQTTGISESCGFMQRITNRVIGIIEKYGSTVMVISDKIGSYSPGSAERRYQKLLVEDEWQRGFRTKKYSGKRTGWVLMSTELEESTDIIPPLPPAA